MFNQLKHKAVRTARQTALFLVAGIFALVGIVLLTASGWIYLELRYDSLMATIVIALVYIALALIALVTGQHISEPKMVYRDEDELLAVAKGSGDMPPLASAFIFGLNAGLKVDERKSA